MADRHAEYPILSAEKPGAYILSPLWHVPCHGSDLIKALSILVWHRVTGQKRGLPGCVTACPISLYPDNRRARRSKLDWKVSDHKREQNPHCPLYNDPTFRHSKASSSSV